MSLEFRIAKTEEELEKVFRIRFQIYLASGYIKKEDFPDGLERDEYEDCAINFYGQDTKAGEITGAIRLVLDSSKGFPLEQLFDITNIRKKNKSIAEVSRRVTLPNKVKTNLGLLKCVCLYGEKNGIDAFICAVNLPDVRFYKKLGLTKIGETKFYKKVNRLSFPMYIELDKFNKPYDSLLFKPDKHIIID